jgi:hypothetical protein
VAASGGLGPRDDEIASRIETFLEQTDPDFAPDEDEDRRKEDTAQAEPPDTEVDQSTKRDPRRDDPLERDEDIEADAKKAREAEEAKKAAESEAEEGEPEEPEAAVESVADLAQAFGVEEGDFLESISVSPAEGMEPVSLKTLVERYTEPVDTGPSESEQVFQAKRQELESNFGDKFKELQVVTGAMLDVLDGDKGKLDSLRHDPTAYIEMRERVDRQQAAVQKSIDHMRRLEAEHSQEMNREREQSVQREAQKLLAKRPEWRDDAKRAVAMQQTREHLKSIGFTEEDIGDLVDSRMVIVAHQASEYARLVAKVKGAKTKKLLRLPKVTMGRTARDETRPQREVEKAKDDKWSRLEATGDTDDAAALIAELELGDL